VLIGSWLSLSALADCTDPTEAAANDAAIQTMYDLGEAARKLRTAEATQVLRRDDDRVHAVFELVSDGRVCGTTAKWQAAWILTQGDDQETLLLAYDLAKQTMKAREPRGPWLTAFTFDHKSVAEGNLQRYGTALATNPVGYQCVVAIEPGVTDEERALYGIGPAADQWRKLLDAAGFTKDQPTLEAVERRGLQCARPEPLRENHRKGKKAKVE
jgi:hypothetical protein